MSLAPRWDEVFSEALDTIGAETGEDLARALAAVEHNGGNYTAVELRRAYRWKAGTRPRDPDSVLLILTAAGLLAPAAGKEPLRRRATAAVNRLEAGTADQRDAQVE